MEQLPMDAKELFALVTGKDVASLGEDEVTGIELLDKVCVSALMCKLVWLITNL